MFKKKKLIHKIIYTIPLFISVFVINTAFSQNNTFINLKKLEKDGNQISALVVRLSDARVIAELNPDKRLSPASVSKLILASNALETWGSNKTFTSKVFMRGTLNKDILIKKINAKAALC